MERLFAISRNYLFHSELRDRFQTPVEQVSRLLKKLDGEDNFAICLWELPHNVPFDEVDLEVWPMEFLQAGGDCHRMTVEVRVLSAGEPKQSAIGRDEKLVGRPESSIRWGASEIRLLESEVFEADQAIPLFERYLSGKNTFPGYRLRDLGL